MFNETKVDLHKWCVSGVHFPSARESLGMAPYLQILISSIEIEALETLEKNL